MNKRAKIKKQILSGPLADDLVCSVCECARNLLKGNVPLTSDQKRKLARHKGALRKIVKKETPATQKKKIVQRGGFLGAVLGPLVGSVLLPLAKKIFT